MLLASLYVVVAALANLSIATFGATATPIVAFLCIGFDLIARDSLHEAWHGDKVKLGVLIACGSLVSLAVNSGSASIALASFCAFACAGVSDTVVYTALRDRDRFVKMNGSNLVSALVDSLVFPTLAFGAFLPLVIVGQYVGKVVGGLVWSLILRK